MAQEISNKVLSVLVILAVVVSIVGTFSVFQAVNRPSTMPSAGDSVSDSPTTQGEVSIGIVNQDQLPKASGRVILDVVPSS
ncbi:MAG: hypothetical protein ACQESC_00230 [Nanobdellota archaeon]